MSRAESLQALVKDFGVVRIAKSIVESGNGPNGTALTEAEFTKIIHDHAQQGRRSGESPDHAFARCFTADDDDGLAFRRAHAVVKNFPRMAPVAPVVAGGNAAFNVDNNNRAADLDEAVKAEMASAPWLTVEQATARVEAARLAVQRANARRGPSNAETAKT